MPWQCKLHARIYGTCSMHPELIFIWVFQFFNSTTVSYSNDSGKGLQVYSFSSWSLTTIYTASTFKFNLNNCKCRYHKRMNNIITLKKECSTHNDIFTFSICLVQQIMIALVSNSVEIQLYIIFILIMKCYSLWKGFKIREKLW